MLYIGKAWGTTIYDRFNAPDKQKFFRYIEQELDLTATRLIAGEIWLDDGTRLTKQLLLDIESLLIHRIKPFGNITAIRSRTQRPGLRVFCTGSWPLARRGYLDVPTPRQSRAISDSDE